MTGTLHFYAIRTMADDIFAHLTLILQCRLLPWFGAAAAISNYLLYIRKIRNGRYDREKNNTEITQAIIDIFTYDLLRKVCG